jgi:hypothetical protein
MPDEIDPEQITDASQMRPEHAVFTTQITADQSQELEVPPVQDEDEEHHS